MLVEPRDCALMWDSSWGRRRNKRGSSHHHTGEGRERVQLAKVLVQPRREPVYSLTGIATPCLTLRAKFRAPPLKRETQSHRSLSAKATRHWSLRTPAYMRCAQGAGAPPDLVAARANGAQKTNSRSSRSFGRLPAAASSAGPSAYKTKSS